MQAFVRLAIVVMQVKESLRLISRSHLETHVFPLCNKAVFLGWKLLEQLHRLFDLVIV